MVVCFVFAFAWVPTAPPQGKNLGDSILFVNNPKEQEWGVEHVLTDEEKPMKCELQSD